MVYDRQSGNSFDLIRHVAAFAVLVSHHSPLSGRAEPMIDAFHSLGNLAVMAFFAISGFLISDSWIKNPGYGYFIRRSARILPALAVCSFVMVFCLAPFLMTDGLSFIFSKDAILAFFRAFLIGKADITNASSSFIFKNSLNGSLWTLKFEAFFYVVLAFILVIQRRAFLPLCLVFCLFVTAFYVQTASVSELAPKLAIYMSVAIPFFMGMALFMLGVKTNYRFQVILLTVSSFFILVSWWGGLYPLFDLFYACFIVSFGLLYKEKIIRRRFDISYGFYLYAFPVQQVVINKFGFDFLLSMLVSVVITAAIACLSWFLVEKPFLRLVHGKSQVSLASCELKTS